MGRDLILAGLGKKMAKVTADRSTSCIMRNEKLLLLSLKLYEAITFNYFVQYCRSRWGSFFVSSYRTGDNSKGKAEQEPNRGKVH